MSDEMTPPDYIKMIRDWSAMIERAPRPVRYIVMDHACPRTEVQKGVDSRGERYAVVNPSILDAMRHQTAEQARQQDPMRLMMGVPLYKRESMVEGWPDNL